MITVLADDRATAGIGFMVYRHVSRRSGPDDRLASIAELAELFGVSKPTAIRYTQRPDFPQPLDRVAAGPIWRRADVEEWARAPPPPPATRERGRRRVATALACSTCGSIELHVEPATRTSGRTADPAPRSAYGHWIVCHACGAETPADDLELDQHRH